MKDSDVMGEDGFYVQEYTIHVGAPIYPDDNQRYGQRVEQMMAQNYEVWKGIYETEYQMPLSYESDAKKEQIS